MITKNSGSRSVLIQPSGDLDALTADHYRQRLRPLFDDGFHFFIVDFEDTDHVTSSGLGLLIEIYNWTQGGEGSIRVINCGERILWLLRQTKLDKILLGEKQPEKQEVKLDGLHALMSREILFCSKINEITEKILKLADRERIAELILGGILSACGSARGALYFYDADADGLELGWSTGFAMGEQPEAKSIALDVACAETEILSDPKIVRIGPAEEPGDPAPSLLKNQLDFSSALLLPIHGEVGNLGIVILEKYGSEEEWEATDDPLLKTYADICGLALEKADLVDRLQCQNEDLQQSLQEVQKFQNTLVDVGKLASLGAVISGMGHLLNNKLVPIIGYTQLLTQTPGLPEKTQSQLNSVNSAAVELKAIMDKLIKVSGSRTISADSIDLNEMIGRTITLLGYHIEKNRVALRLNQSEELPKIEGDHDLLMQAFVALLHRACASFAPDAEERWIEISSWVSEKNICVRIEDNGNGLGAVSVDEWIDPLAPYIELDQGQLFNFSIPRSVIRRHQGELELEERADGGTVVTLTLPIKDDNLFLARISADNEIEEIA